MKKLLIALILAALIPMNAQAKINPPKEYEDAAIKVAHEQCLFPEWYLVKAYKESKFNKNAVGDDGESLGCCQIQPRWIQDKLKEHGYTEKDLFKIEVAFIIAGEIFLEHLDKYKYPDLAEMKYNGQPNAVELFEQGIISQYAQDMKDGIAELQRGQ